MTRKIYIVLALIAAFASPALAEAPAAAGVRIVVPARDIARGDTVSESDLTYATVAGNALMSGTVTSFNDIKGMQTRRLLHAGEALRADDVRRPIVVSKGQTVTMLFQAPGVELAAMGRAMSEGGVGDTVTIQNPTSFRMITGTVTGAGTVVAGAAAPALQLTARR